MIYLRCLLCKYLDGLHVAGHRGRPRAVFEVGFGVVVSGRSVGGREVIDGVHLQSV